MQQNHVCGILLSSEVVGTPAKETDVCFDLLFSLNLRGYCTISFVITLGRVKNPVRIYGCETRQKSQEYSALFPSRERE